MRHLPPRPRIIPERSQATSGAENLRTIVRRLRATGAKLVWINTTPILQTRNELFDQGSEIAFNAIAAKVMQDHQLPILDLHGHATAEVAASKEKLPADHPFSFGRIQIHQPVTQLITRELGLQLPPTPAPTPKKP